MSLDFNKTDLKDNVLIITNDDGSIQCIPEDGATEGELAMFEEFRREYQEGKPQPIIQPQEPQPSTEDYLIDLDYRISKKELGV